MDLSYFNFYGIIMHSEKMFSANDPPDEHVIHAVNHILQDAKTLSVSDIHIEPLLEYYRVRFRRDGILSETKNMSHGFALRLNARLKVLAKLDIAEKRLPQDGRFQSHGMDIRINSCPTLFGEKIVLRLLDTSKISLTIDQLGFLPYQKKIFIDKISEPQGLILVTGPTGSGKTVTLYSALQYRNTPEVNISAVEDPIEIQLKGINQVNIHPKIGLNFPEVLRALLRQDPDIIMIGEIRDTETAEIAIQAANTGHLVFATLHTNSALDALSRLHSLGITHDYLEHAITLILGQRLIRKLCELCKKPAVDHSQYFEAHHCESCLNGYQGRIGIYECIMMTEKISQHISNRNYLKSIETDTLKKSAYHQLHAGLTSLDEIKRVIQS